MISVCLATYNGEQYIEKQIASILTQLSIEDEIVVSDDRSTDKTLEILKNINDKRIKIFHNNKTEIVKSSLFKFYKATRNFENALFHAKNNYIFLCDQDDIWEENKVEVMLSYLKDFDLVVSDYSLIDEFDRPIISDFKRLKSNNFLKNIIKTPYLGCAMAFNKRVLSMALPFPPKLLAHDLWIGFIAQQFGRVVFLDDKLVRYRRHSMNVSFSTEQSKNSLFVKIMYRINFVRIFIKRVIKIII